MGKRLTLILGGARSGKSTHAEKLSSERGKAVLYVATAEAKDREMRTRIAKHRERRPAHWKTLEAPRNLRSLIHDCAGEAEVILIDCITLLASNIVLDLPESVAADGAETALGAEIDGLLTAYEESVAEWILVSNEVGLGVVPPYPSGRLYRDLLGTANQRLAGEADVVLFMVVGLPMQLKG